jgi:murein DD-endopeptidase MepM/ murein hydrolase activator NlpD
VTLLRPIVLVIVIGAAAVFGTRMRDAHASTAPDASPAVAAVHVQEEAGPLDTAIDLPEHGRGPVVPASALTGFAVPPGYEVPDDPDLLPNSPREYRAGYHEGVDFPLSMDMPVYAAKAGVVIRIDREYVEWSDEALIAAQDAAYRLGYTPPETLDKLRGRQVWIDHGDGVVTRYAHLASVEPISVGSYVTQGTLIGTVGNSGLKAGPHLHIEIRVGDDYLGEGLSGDALLRVLHRAFSVTPAE